MSNIQTTKIDWVEFVTYKDYLRLKEEKQELEYLWDINEELKEENKKLKEENEKRGEAIKDLNNYNKFRILENKNLKERIAELEKCNLNLQEQIDKITKDRDERKRKEECSNVIIERAKEKGRENWWTI